MLMNLRPVLFGSVALLLSCGDPHSASPTVALAQSGHSSPISAMTPAAMAVDLGASPASVDELGVPRLLRGTDQGPAIPAATATASAVGHLARLAPVWGVAGGAL